MPQAVELRDIKEGALDAENVRRRQLQFADGQLVAPKVPRDRLPAIGILGAAEYKGATLSDPVDISGHGNPRVTGEVTFLNRAVVRGIEFRAAVHVGAAGNAEFVGCRFLAAVTVVAGGRIVATGCRFDGTSSILNAGVAADSFSTGNIKTSTVLHTNTTITGGG